MLKAMRLDWIWISYRISINYYGNHAVFLIKFHFLAKMQKYFHPIWDLNLWSIVLQPILAKCLQMLFSNLLPSPLQ